MPRGINSLKCAHHDAYRLFPLQTWKDVVFVDSRPSPFPPSATVYVLSLYPSSSVQLFHFHLSRPFPSPPFARFSTTRCRRGRMAACQLQLAIAAAYLGPDREEKKEGRRKRRTRRRVGSTGAVRRTSRDGNEIRVLGTSPIPTFPNSEIDLCFCPV